MDMLYDTYYIKTEEYIMSKRWITIIIVLSLLLTALVCLPIHGEDKIYDTVVRLHVLAHSDTDEDQALKLQVRDALLEITAPLLDGCHSQEEAITVLTPALDDLKATAQAVVQKAGFDYAVSVDLGEEAYPKRVYETCCFPAGTYVSLRVGIGEAAGQNWWCVLFPPLCLSAAEANDPADAFVSVGLNKNQYGIITETTKTKYKIRFKLLETFQQWWN
jgi:stage II sporulation protein R